MSRNLLFDVKPRVGDYIKFGNFPQNKAAIEEPIEWLVLEIIGNNFLLISRYGLDYCEYHNRWSSITWERCDLREWLNRDFLNKAFSEDEQQRIKLSRLVNDDNPKYRTSGGNNTLDRVFCLSVAEAKRYFKNNAERRCQPTEYAHRCHCLDEHCGCCRWWLRSPVGNERYGMFVAYSGYIWYDALIDIDLAVRPALWVNVES